MKLDWERVIFLLLTHFLLFLADPLLLLQMPLSYFLFQTNGNSNGLVPMLRVYNNTARYVDQGGNKVCFVIESPRNQN